MKDIQKLLVPKAFKFDTGLVTKSNPEIYNVSYDLWTLTITLGFDDVNGPVYVIFKNVIGFRVLDEGDLLEFWNDDVRVPGWIWKIESGGWFELEKLRTGFLTQHHKESHDEFLVSGMNDCVSIIAESEPVILRSE
ncbi:hypothetical protein [Flavobacterium pallidum]|uniref:Uncharacterized protein n=1 Tax=Flavobacterium pallidum TaxID=2172098 RepID=A0A2S1SK78_9FLAO|nr:hypothetical protein [Flavobacterium pallidum]AWI26830.1 hypothetical protein HYN49_13495 [Flavobacterium pallidum]